MKSHYSQTPFRRLRPKQQFYYLMKSHYSQTQIAIIVTLKWFYYLMKSHYSQTTSQHTQGYTWFYYLMKSHYSQTSLSIVIVAISFTTLWNHTILKLWRYYYWRCRKFYYLMKSHYSQTIKQKQTASNKFYYLMKSHYSQTGMSRPWQAFIVLLPYEITLFSNTVIWRI